ncbi:DUF3833 domain-containing protein [Roseateles violae]|uniref:DUF3833 domain-containing protein n=1 Tax=Roseateles violae TaxID=3058042 RepID=A0ABT8DUL7_9BURK|nr:DUF3833 domain-containing protein [Pelomonas sp. PFR6]MDN3920087.1 DUF3833 domain-containing protein [Pelomonas sp. PFR6]
MNPLARTSMPLRRRLVLAMAALALAGCAGPQVQDYANETPRFDMRAFLSGDLTAKGVFTDRSGRVVKRFSVTMNGRWDGDEGVLDERFQYSDGSTQRRVWKLRQLAPGRYTGTADDVVGEALGESAGNALRWTYTLALPVDGRIWHVSLDDWMFLMDERTVLNRSAMSKLGVHLGDVTLVISKDR